MSKDTKQPLRIIPIGGLGEIGLNCMAFEYEDEILIIDCGVMFSELQLLGIDVILPDMSYLDDKKHKIKAYLITHAHEDHIGALPYALKKYPAPIYCTNFAKKLIEGKMEEHGLTKTTVYHPFIPGNTYDFKHFKASPIFVNHSIIEAMSVFLDTPQGKIVFTGDFKIDSNPFYGKPFDPAPFEKIGKDGVRLLMSDSTNVERDGHSLSESTIYEKFEEIFKYANGLVVVAVFASNIGRIGQIIEIAKKLDKKVALLGRSMDSNVKTAFELGYLKELNDILISIDDVKTYERSGVIILSTGSQGEYRSALSRIATNEHKDIKLQEGDLVVMSSKFIPGNEKAIGRMVNSLFKLGSDVLYESVADIHVSGHANAGELRQMIEWTKPSYFVPVHGEYRHLVKHRKLALEYGLTKNEAIICVNGDILELDEEGLRIADHYDENRIFIEDLGKNEVARSVIKDRRKIAEGGIVFCAVFRSEVDGRILIEPEITTRGIFEKTDEANASRKTKLIETDVTSRAVEVVYAILQDCAELEEERKIDIVEEIRIGLRKYFNNVIGRKPVVVPIVLDV